MNSNVFGTNSVQDLGVSVYPVEWRLEVLRILSEKTRNRCQQKDRKIWDLNKEMNEKFASRK